jgi:phosphoribosylamine--glycine ligase
MTNSTTPTLQPRTGIHVHVVGSGAREHAIVWKLAQSPHRPRLTCSPGNAGIAEIAGCANVPADDVAATVAHVRAIGAELVVVGPEAALAAGLVDQLAAEGIAAVGPTAAAARIESSKSFAKEVMRRAGVRTAAFERFTQLEPALAHIRDVGAPVVVKADGLAAGKGVVVAQSVEQACEAAVRLLDGPGGEAILVEQLLTGPELSVLGFTDGTTLRLLPTARDHKRLDDADHGPNTGGMGAFAPVPEIGSVTHTCIGHDVLQPVIDELRAEGTPFRGVLYAGLMLTSAGPRVIEFNARLGDPEAQVLLPLLESDLLELLLACANGTLADAAIEWSDRAAVTVVAAGREYPHRSSVGAPISGVDGSAAGPVTLAPDTECVVFHAGTSRAGDGQLVTNGGRVLSVTGIAPDVPRARAAAYARLRVIGCPDLRHRTDIAATASAGTPDPAHDLPTTPTATP